MAITDPLEKVAAIRAAMPSHGLFAEKDWLTSPEPFAMTNQQVDELEKLGYRLALFQRACNQLYHLSVKGKQPEWIARYLDLGKPPELVEFSRRQEFRNDLPLVIRPDLVLTEECWTIAELDTVPGGIGLTAWLNQVYASLGYDVLGGATGMLDGFRSLLPEGGDILVSQEAATYRPEMQWIADELAKSGCRLQVLDAETYQPSTLNSQPAAYRFFEHFDLPNIPSAPAIMNAAAAGTLRVTPPFKPFMEEKMWFALFWMHPLRDYWRRELRDHHFKELQKVIPYTWIVDPAPLPHHAVLPHLNIHHWGELAHFSQKERELIMKISGFSELSWGGRGVSVAQDLPQKEWAATVQRALDHFPTTPRILQRFHKGRIVEQPYADSATQTIRTMQGRVRLCPYYFIEDGKATLRGALATICPPDKKLLHGMRDAILAPVQIVEIEQK
ncbi:MAG: hypothetical protein QM796_01520 [Chthoniobacteraceae bacterium]